MMRCPWGLSSRLANHASRRDTPVDPQPTSHVVADVGLAVCPLPKAATTAKWSFIDRKA